ncbi:MAPEG family protein [Pontixanthobacter aquaemixtae]|uniref:MAPEG family protein n=1 Tax=Pontixanthobacter aquaemixtae TaxID=1958940 RepID=A0A844ZQI5_9SPHN|nr:MAPEG family protein [Pontixanthobacter aquaemixtae]MXO90053.1 MAPEG family protein [Pontixanthobacter aquaemixtae]
MPLPITATVAAICGLLLLITAIMTVRQRFRLGVAFGDASDQALISASRSHANLAEHAPIVLIMLGLLENGEASSTALMVIGGAFVAGRVAHIIGLHGKIEPGKPPLARQIGVIVTWLTLLALAVMILLGVFA